MSVPISPTVPGWTLGSKDGPIEVRVFYDLLCDGSKEEHYIIK